METENNIYIYEVLGLKNMRKKRAPKLVLSLSFGNL
jgi:hypothetical protein